MGTKLFLKNSSNQFLKNSSGSFLYRTLPPEYQEVEYIGAGSGQYIATNLNFNHISSLEIFGKSYVSSSGTRACIASEYAAGSRLSIEILSGLRLYNDANPDFSNAGLALNATSEYDIRYNRPTQTITTTCNGIIASRSSATYGNSGVSFYLFVDRELRFSTFNKVHRLYYFKIIKDGKDYCYLVPCVRNSDGKPGLYDLVNSNFYTNAGTGEFTIGPCKDLPSTYQWVEYIQSSGSQHINTGYTPNVESAFLGRFVHTEHTIDTPLYGVRTSNYGNSYTFWAHPAEYTASGKNTMIFNNYQYQFPVGYSEGTNEVFYCSKNIMQCNDQIHKYTVSSGSPNLPLILLGLSNGGTIDGRKFAGRLYNFKICENNILVRNFIPCYRKSDSVIGLYDTVNQQFYTNAGTGTFTKGSDIG